MDFEQKIRFFAKEKFTNLAKLSRELELDPSYLQRIMKGKVQPGKDFFIKMLNLGCNLNWLLREEQENNHVIAEPNYDYKPTEEETAEKDEQIRQLEEKIKKIQTITK